MTRFILCLAIVFSLGACSTLGSVNTAANTPVTQEQIASAKDVSYGLEASYVVALRLATVWGQPGNRCGKVAAPPPPLCSTVPAMEQVEVVRDKFRSALNRLNSVIANTTTTTSVLKAAIDIAKGAWAEYQQALPAT